MKQGRSNKNPPKGSRGSRLVAGSKRKPRRKPSVRTEKSERDGSRLVESRIDKGLGPTREERLREFRAVLAMLWLSVLIFLLMSGSVLAFQFWSFVEGDREETSVPEIVGMQYEDAAVVLEEAGIVLRIRAEAYDDDIEADIIIAQLPAPGCGVKLGREVLVDISLGSRNLTTPNVIGLDRNEAITQLESLGLSYRFLNPRYSDVAEVGTIINQRPPMDAPIALGESVELVCSAGPLSRAFTMPQLEGLPYEEALLLIEENRLVVRRVSRTYQPGAREIIVSSQYPIYSAQVRQGDEVLLTLICPTSYQSLGERSVRIRVTVPESAGSVQVKIVVQDRYETREEYLAVHTGPTSVERLITSYGRTTVKVYFDNRIVREETF